MNKNQLIIHPLYLKQVKKNNNLRKELIVLTNEETKIIETDNTRIEVIYNTIFGPMAIRLQHKKEKINILKRKLELIEQAIRNDEEVNLDFIDDKIKFELLFNKEEYHDRYDDNNDLYKFDDILTLDSKQLQELKNIYRLITKYLHPDLNDNKEHIKLFYQAVSAYKKQNLTRLKIIALMLSLNIIDDDSNSMELLKKEEKILKELITKVDHNIDKIKMSYPYNLHELIEGEQKFKQYQEYLKLQLLKADEQNSYYDDKIKELLNNKEKR